MVGLAPEHASRYLLAGGLTTLSSKASFVGGRVASLGGLAKLRPTLRSTIFVGSGHGMVF